MEQTGPTDKAGGIYGTHDAQDGLATVYAGLFAEQLPVAGMRVGEIRARYADRLKIHRFSRAVLDGQLVDEDTVVEAGHQVLAFVLRGGEMGPPRPWP